MTNRTPEANPDSKSDFGPAKFEIYLCPERKVPVCGNLVGSPRHLYIKRECEIEWKRTAAGEELENADFALTLEGQIRRVVAEAKFYFPLVGARFNHRWYGWNARYLVYDPLPEAVWPFLRSSATSFSSGRVEAALGVRDELWRAEQDGLQSLMPLIVLFQRSPRDLKALLGTGTWKKLTSNTKSRNRLICLLADKSVAYARHDDVALPEWVRFLTTVESSVIRYFTRSDVHHAFSKDMITAARQSATYALENIERRLQLYRDTEELLYFENRRCNPVWSNKRLRREHDRAVKVRMATRQNRGEETEFCPPFLYRSPTGPYCAQRLQSERQIVQEAIEQCHCVDTYSEQAKADFYAVFKITGPQRATLGVSIRRSRTGRLTCEIDQVTLKFNADASDVTAGFCVEVVGNFARSLNEHADGRPAPQKQTFRRPKTEGNDS